MTVRFISLVNMNLGSANMVVNSACGPVALCSFSKGSY